MSAKFVKAHLLDAPYHIDRPYDYFLPPALADEVHPGSIVSVPFGGGNRRLLALVTEVTDSTSAENPKTVLAVACRRYPLDENTLGLCLFLSEHTLCTVGEALRTVIPPNLLSEIGEYYSVSDASDLKKPENAGDALMLEYIRSHSHVSLGTLTANFGKGATAAVTRLTDAGYLFRECESEAPKNIKYKKKASLAVTPEEARDIISGRGAVKLRSEKHVQLLSELLQSGAQYATDLCARCGASMAQINALVKKGLARTEDIECDRNPYADAYSGRRDTSEIVLSRAQGEAYEKLLALYEKRKPEAALLYGITGSGKTKVIMKLLDRTLSEGRTAIMMVPEISLTPQTVSIFCSRYGERVAVMHSSLAPGERFDTWRRIADGKVDLVIGTRSAIFAPLKNIGLIVIDEEHEHTYKSDSDPKYHTRDVAAYRAKCDHSMLLLASATPSLESFYRAQRGVYTLVELRERYGAARLPDVEIVDMREELRQGHRSPISTSLLRHLEETKENGKQAILFINRRGYSSTLSCKDCGKAVLCPNCSISLTYHTSADGGYMLCHCCGYRSHPPGKCPDCGGTHMSYLGFGTQKVESEMSVFLPSLSVLRMDADTTGAKLSHAKMLDKFRRRDYDVLLGTQMVTKGHDFPEVSLVGVMLADSSLYVSDFRAAERTFALITQVIGRAGRADTPGLAVIQTYSPENEVIRLATTQDYDRFYESEIAVRRSLLFPPFCDMAQFTLTASDETELMQATGKFASRLLELAGGEYKDLPLTVFGPFEAQQYKAAGKYRMRIVVKCRLGKRTREMFALLLREAGACGNRKITYACDLNPSDV